MSKMLLRNKVAVVTGAGRGIGRAVALRLAQEGANVVVNDCHEDNAKKVAEEIKQINGISLWIAADVTNQAAVANMFSEVIEKFSRIDVLVTCAGVTQVNTLEELSEKQWDRTVSINAKGTYLCVLAAARQMIKQKSGKIIMIGSDFAIEGAKYHVCYSASKFAVRGMMQAFAKELAPYEINVNCVCPGIIWTEMWEEADKKLARIFDLKEGEAFKKFTEELVLLPKPGKPAYIAPVVAFLASEDADYITGQTILVGGGSMIL